MATPESPRNSQLRPEMFRTPPISPVSNTIPQAITSTTMVRMAVARLELTPAIPILARMDVSAANTADSSAKINHIIRSSFPLVFTGLRQEWPFGRSLRKTRAFPPAEL